MALMATIVCEIHNSDDRFDWTGFYRVTEPKVLKVGPTRVATVVCVFHLIVAYAESCINRKASLNK